MQKNSLLIFLCLLLVVLVASCVPSVQETAPVQTNMPTMATTNTASPTLTLTPIETPTLTPTFTPTPFITIGADNATLIAEISRLGNGLVSDVDWLADGQQFAVSSFHSIYIYDARTLELARIIPQPSESAAFSPDGQKAAFCYDGNITLWDMTSAQVTNSLKDSELDYDQFVCHSPRAFTFSPDSSTLAFNIYDKSREVIGLLDILHPDQELQTLSGLPIDFVIATAFSPDGQTLAVGMQEGSISFWDIANHKQVGDFLRIHPGESYSRIKQINFSSDGSQIVSLSGFGWLDIVDIETKERLLLAGGSGVEQNYSNAALSPDGSTLATTAEQEIKLWDMQTRTERAVMDGYENVEQMLFSPDGSLLLSVLAGGKFVISDTETRQELATMQWKGHNNAISHLMFLPNAKTLISASVGFPSQALFWDVRAQEVINSLPGYIISPDGKVFSEKISSSNEARQDLQIELYDVEDQSLWQTFITTEILDPNFLSMTLDSNFFVIYKDGLVQIWNIPQKGDPVSFYHKGNVMDVDISPDGSLLAAAVDNNTVRVWETSTGSLVKTLQGYTNWEAHSVSFSPDGKLLAGGSGPAVIIWDTSALEKLFTLEEPEPEPPGQSATEEEWKAFYMYFMSQRYVNYIETLAFSPDSALLATSGTLGKVALWNMEDGSLLAETSVPGKDYNRDLEMAFSPDGTLIALTLDEGIIYLLGVP